MTVEQILDRIPPEISKNLAGLFVERVRRTPDNIAYRYYANDQEQWQDISWQEMAHEVAKWRAALEKENFQTGDRVGIMLPNCPEWVKFEQAALGLGLVVVPLYTNDRPDNIGFIIQNAGIKCILFEGAEHWTDISSVKDKLNGVQSFLSLEEVKNADDNRIHYINDWVIDTDKALTIADIDPDSLASIVYTSGTTGNPKGVMLSHQNILWNAYSCTTCEEFYTDDVFLSFLPLSHMFERTAGYYMAMNCGSTVAYARSIEQLAEDLLVVRPTILVTVPRIFERVYNKIKTQLAAKPPIAGKLFAAAVAVGWQCFEHQQGRAAWQPKQLLWRILNALVAKKVIQKLGGRMRKAICGGAPLSLGIAKTFVGLGLTIVQGYGMTELSPVVSVNRLKKNDPASVGLPLDDVEVKLGENDELIVRCPGVMLGYWNNPQATQDIIDADGWLHTGDVAKIENEFIYITGRIKEIIVMSNGEKVPPADIEMAIATDTLFEQAMIVGEAKPFLTAIVVLNTDNWKQLAEQLGVDAENEAALNDETVSKILLDRIGRMLKGFPGYANIYQVHASLQPWTIAEGLITPTLKLKRAKLHARYGSVIERFYSGH